jgi:hypothetical protein
MSGIEWTRTKDTVCDSCCCWVYNHEPMYYVDMFKICELCAVVAGL